MSRLVIDTNVLLSSFISSGPPRLIVNRIRDQLDQLCLSQPILQEYVIVLRRESVTEGLLASLVSLLQDPDRVLLVFPSERVEIIREDPSDNMFLECAMEARADYIISGDRHLRKLKSFHGIEIIAPREYVLRLRAE